ncbi:small subunit ribosomal protein S16e [Pancytospora epiphaga]|nr:small subunit ribosomal protein S16e [Pancytospora epiphaga]
MENGLVTTRGEKKSAVATCVCKNTGSFEIRVNKVPLDIHTDKIMAAKYNEIVKIIGEEVLNGLDFDIKTAKVSSHVGNIYAGRQAFVRAVLAYLSVYSDEYKRQEVRNAVMAFDRYAIVTDTRKKEAKKFGGPGARARYQKSYR